MVHGIKSSTEIKEGKKCKLAGINGSCDVRENLYDMSYHICCVPTLIIFVIIVG